MQPAIDELIRSDRRTLSFRVDGRGRLIVRAPKRMPLKAIHAALLRHADWIAERRSSAFIAHDYEQGDTFRLLDEAFELRFSERVKRGVMEDGGALTLPAGLTHDERRELILSWYRREARRYFGYRVKELAPMMGQDVPRVRISSANTRWGSCSKSGLNLNFKLMLTPKDIADYVMVHELAHRKHMDHSAGFWAEVERYVTDYKERRSWLKQHGAGIMDEL